MKLKYSFPLLVLLIFCSCKERSLTDQSDYAVYLNEDANTSNLMEDVTFWTNKLEANPEQFPYLAKRANVYTKLFDATGNISYLKKAEQDLTETIALTDNKMPSYQKQLAANYISQHRFKEALQLLKMAEANGENLSGTKKMLFDVHLELGNFMIANTYLNQIKNNKDFDYLIRLAKWEDHNGNLEGAILNMESALAIAERSNLKGIKQWSYTNLADFYGHAGQIEKSYNYYLKALALDPNDAYAKKGIAWILYSHEKNTEEALKILDHISSYYQSPDHALLKAEIAEFSNDLNLKNKSLINFKSELRNKAYGAMYNKHKVLIYTDEFLLPEQALEIAKLEVEQRPTPQSYDLLAWSYFKLGDVEKANAIIEEHVDGKTSEPDVLYHIAEVYKSMGKNEKVKELKNELVASLYELGPTMAPKINQL
ncbi:tetratricopeptide repeat protein [Winogradskyella tangerina]|uniref:tetratricopeptide repeat protein n=1 Tax=Winogradskyella tangerina TaxID=2023240 RepID=UPI000DBE4167|nr:tetratricopeptide repeat protein [Winogradskyella tangerina]